MGSGGRRHVDVFVPPRQRGVVRCFQVELHQPQQRVEKSLGLSERRSSAKRFENDPETVRLWFIALDSRANSRRPPFHNGPVQFPGRRRNP